VHIYKYDYLMACGTLLLYWRSRKNIWLKRYRLDQAIEPYTQISRLTKELSKHMTLN
jgi:hypothetical protein